MLLRRSLMLSTALAGAGLAMSVGVASAAEVKPGGALDLIITGFLRAEAFGGQQDDLQLDPSLSRSLDFRNDTEVHILAHGEDEETGLEYGATIEFEADTNSTLNTDQTWIFLRGGWGELRFGDQDGIVDNSTIGGQTIAAGTGGIDGSDAVVSAAPVVFLTLTDDATKIRYYTPSFGGFSLGVSYTPTQEEVDSGALNGQFIAHKNGDDAMQGKNVVEGGLVYDDELGGVGIESSIVGLHGSLKNGGKDDFGGDDWWGVQGGAALDISGFKLGAGIGTDHVGDQDRQYFTAGVGYGYGPLNTSITYGQIFDSNSHFQDANDGMGKPYNLVFSADYALAPGLVLAGDVSSFDNDTDSTADTGAKGWAAVGRFEVAF